MFFRLVALLASAAVPLAATAGDCRILMRLDRVASIQGTTTGAPAVDRVLRRHQALALRTAFRTDSLTDRAARRALGLDRVLAAEFGV